MTYDSSELFKSKIRDGVTYTVNRISFGRRLELMRRVRALAPRLECFQAGTSQQDQIEARILSAEIDQLYLEWGLKSLSGLQIDGHLATPSMLLEFGPEEIVTEALACVKRAAQLSESEIKN